MLLKRLFDFYCATLGLLLLSPALLAVALWIKMDSSGSVFFRQIRVGQHGHLFRIYKFRTMVQNAEAKGRQITVMTDPRITRSGHFLRKHKLDELPQLLNVVLGEMSLVGPRPEVPRYVEKWPDISRQLILSVPPGITDFASIEFRSENDLLEHASDPEREYIEHILPIKVNYYLKYVRERSFWLDLVLIFRTL